MNGFTTEAEVVACCDEVFSLHTELLDVSAGSCVATNLIQRLIKVISYNIWTSKNNTQTHTAYLLVNIARQIYKSINVYINDIGQEDKNTWLNYKKYIGNIHPLEGLLFRLLKLSKEESGLRLPSYESVSGCVDSVTRWTESVTQIRTIATEFCNIYSEFAEDIGDISHRIHIGYRLDDLDFLMEICYRIQKIDFGHVEKIKNKKVLELIAATQNFARNIQSLTLKNLGGTISDVTQTVVISSIKCTMFVYGVMYIASTTSSVEERTILMSETTWTTVKGLLSRLHAHLDTFDISSSEISVFTTLEYDFDTFMIQTKTETLAGVEFHIVKSFMDLRKKAVYVGRRFLTQTWLLLDQFQKLEGYYEEQKITASAQISQVIKLAEAALDGAIVATRELETSANDVKVVTATQAFSVAVVELKKCVGNVQTAEEWADYDSKMTCATTDDWDYAALFKDELEIFKFDPLVMDKPKPKSVISYKLMVYSMSENKFKEYKRCAEGKTTLALILGKEIMTIPEMNAYPSWRFQLSEKGFDNIIGFHCEIGAVRAVGEKLTLYLVPNK